ncbi:hypothetical protein WM00_12590 [Burkholderia cepacia]|nr:hypothetical protein WM00_12590 [Burkholderia cepacia]
MNVFFLNLMVMSMRVAPMLGGMGMLVRLASVRFVRRPVLGNPWVIQLVFAGLAAHLTLL